MARPRKTAEDLVPEENPLAELSETEEGVETPEAETETAAPAGEETPAAADDQVVDAPAEESTAEEPAAEEPPVEEAAAETPVADQATVEEPAAEADEAPADEAPADQAPADEAPADEAPADEPVAEEPASTAEPAAPAAPAKPAKPKTPEKPRKTRAERKARVRPKRRGAAAGTGERRPVVRLPKPEHERGQRKERRGVVVSSAMDKTIVVRVDTAKPDRRYKKVVRRSTKFHAHDERNEANVGDVVRIVETRPLSKTKTWRLVEVVEVAR